jgi:16S rRNA C967 or C1407 C5-methylase (RsmB/RsmF family)
VHYQLQRNLIWAAAWLLKVGGTMVFSTCTFNPGENEAQVAHILENYPLELVPLDPSHRVSTRSVVHILLIAPSINSTFYL